MTRPTLCHTSNTQEFQCVCGVVWTSSGSMERRIRLHISKCPESQAKIALLKSEGNMPSLQIEHTLTEQSRHGNLTKQKKLTKSEQLI